ncbi:MULTISPECIES: quinone oxidoreductase family protein [Vogesella]|jgi:NADPH2:quinone reductase|uniref:NADPH:quinone reductase-like Zn-dependent oxidoreductase n=1 Tax=Vogesella indigofera TaxID=45465 RepID=A0A495BHC8_VOGIN|nr:MULTISPECIES: quinone oxidoreductase [Vogesella]MCQ4144282.1 quinone oxidoreductase [Vogesella sp. AC12]MDC7689281.1 quinone oxidoreductase [Vogesella indigofera]MDC7697168.1 quinone oxidoreductase [Vogesella indigofera]RKQ60261.1 NADPH:quinone reductase-like Zn-dependent oxidoreductase [Vogesella indigofera]
MNLTIRLSHCGGPDVLRAEQAAIPAPAAGEVLLRHTAIGVNFIDTYYRSGLYPLPLPSGLGSEAAGVVAAVGDGVSHLQVGDRVAYAGGAQGAYSQYRTLPAALLVKLPDDIADDTAACVMLQGMTVEYLIRRTYAVEAGQTVLWHAAAGGVGQIAVQWLSSLGVNVIGTVGSADKAAIALRLGCKQVINYREEDVVARVRELTGGRGVPVVYDSVGKDTFEMSLDSLAPRGMLVSFGNASGAVPPFAPLLLSQKGSLFFTRPKLGDYVATRAELETSAEALFERIRAGAVKVQPSARYALADAAQAHADLEARRTTGSLILLP